MDNMFILISAWRRSEGVVATMAQGSTPRDRVRARLSAAMQEAALSITITSLTGARVRRWGGGTVRYGWANPSLWRCGVVERVVLWRRLNVKCKVTGAPVFRMTTTHAGKQRPQSQLVSQSMFNGCRSSADVLAFGIGAITEFRTVELFCLYTGLCITFSYVYCITFFAAAMVFSGWREETNRHCFLFIKVKPAGELSVLAGRVIVCVWRKKYGNESKGMKALIHIPVGDRRELV